MTKTLSFSLFVPETPDVVYQYLINPDLLRFWFSNDFESKQRVGGSYYAAWNNGHYVAGSYTALDPNKRLEMTWMGRGQPGEMQVEITLKAQNGGTQLDVLHSAVPEEHDSDISKGWVSGLENLRYTLETGLDYRFMSRPILGVFPAPLTEKQAQELNLPFTQGVYINGVVDGTGAAAAGLKGGDILLSLNGHALSSHTPLSEVLAGAKGGDVVPVEVYRGAEKHTLEMTLTKRPAPEHNTLSALVEYLEKSHAELIRELDELIASTAHLEMSQRPEGDEWSGNENLAHLIWTERTTHMTLWGLNSGNDFMEWPSNAPLHIGGVMASYPTADLLVEELKRSFAATRAMTALLPETLPKAFVGRLSNELPGIVEHARGHYRQIRDALAAVRQTSGEAG